MTHPDDARSDADYRVTGGGTIYLVRPLTILALKHLAERVSSEAQWHGNALAVEHRYIDGLVTVLRDDGFDVEVAR